MRLRRLKDLVIAVISMPLAILLGTIGGAFVGSYVWVEKVRLCWRMRNSLYAWENENVKS